MSVISIPIERLIFGNEHWRSYRAIQEMEIYCDLLEGLQEREHSLETRGKTEEVTLESVATVISSYAFEIGIKSLWALDNSPRCVPHKHDLLFLFDGLKAETKESLRQLEFTRNELVDCPKPFFSNRYSMEKGDRTIFVYQPQFLRSLSKLVQGKLEETRVTLINPPKRVSGPPP